MKTLFISACLCIQLVAFGQAQSKPLDSVVINVGTNSKMTLVIRDKRDLETLKQYNFQSLMGDLIAKMESTDTTSALKPSASYLNETPAQENKSEEPQTEENWNRSGNTEKLSSSSDQQDRDFKRKYHRTTRQSLSFDLGTNNYLSNGSFPDPGNDLHTVRPWGSWYVAINSVHRTRVARTFFLEYALGLSQYNFKFQNDAINIIKDPTALQFEIDQREGTEGIDFRKSKLSALFLNASFVPVLDFGGNYKKPVLFDGRRSDSFRIGFGPYAGYRIDSYTRKVFKEDGDKRKEKDRDSYYLNNFRYGLRLQLGFRDTDLFFNYDLNELFTAGKGPNLNAFSFGISF